MSILSFNNNVSTNDTAKKDVLSVFRKSPIRSNEIHESMTISEISEVVSENIMNVIRNQFEKAKSDIASSGNGHIAR